MAYIRQDYYKGLYGEISEDDFSRLSWEACRKMDAMTTGIDGIKKLKNFFPADEDDAESVKRCACKLVNLLAKIETAEKNAVSAQGYESTENGIRGKVVTSVTAGNESISYSTAAAQETSIDKAVKDPKYKDNLMNEIIWDHLSGITDSNGVNLLYMGRYPRV